MKSFDRSHVQELIDRVGCRPMAGVKVIPWAPPLSSRPYQSRRFRRLRHDFRRAFRRALRRQDWPRCDAAVDIWRAKQLEYSWVLSLAGRYEPFRSSPKKRSIMRWPHPAIERRSNRFSSTAYRNLAAYPDVRRPSRPCGRGLRPAILSNGDPECWTRSVSSAGLKSSLDPVLSVDGAKIFKTSPSTYRFALSKLLAGHPRGRVRVLEPLGCGGRDRVRHGQRLG